MKEFLEYAKSKGVKEIDVDILCLLSDFFKETEKEQFAISDVVTSLICVDREKLLRLTVGKKYQLIKEHEDSYEIINDAGHKNTYMKHCFKKL